MKLVIAFVQPFMVEKVMQALHGDRRALGRVHQARCEASGGAAARRRQRRGGRSCSARAPRPAWRR